MASSKKTGETKTPGSTPPTKGSSPQRDELDLAVAEARRKLKAIVLERRTKRSAKVTAFRRNPEVQKRHQEVRQKISDFLSNVSDELKLHGIKPSFRVWLNVDQSVDAEIRVPYPDWVKTVDQATDILTLCEEAMDRVPEMQHISVGFTLNPEANDDSVRAGVLQYLKYQGELRLNPNYYDTATGQPLAFQVSYEVLRNVVRVHKMLPTGMLIRMTWSPDGWLYRFNDYDLRRMRGEGEATRARKKRPVKKKALEK